MNKVQLLEEIYDYYTYNLLCYSKNYLMTKPKERYIKEWKNQKEKVALLEEIIKEEKQKVKGEKMSFTMKEILKMYPNTQYYVRNSNGGLLAGTVNLKDAEKYAEEYKKEYLQDPLNNHLGVFVYDKEGKNIYIAKGKQSSNENEEIEEFE